MLGFSMAHHLGFSVLSTRASPTGRLRGRFLRAMLNSVQQGEAQTMSKCPGSRAL